VIDLFVNLNEFVENTQLGTITLLKNIVTYYGLNITLYFRDFAGTITVLAAAFTLAKMVRSNELVTLMSSGMSLKRVLSPFLLAALVLTGLLIVDQEYLIPAINDKLVRYRNTIPGEESYDVGLLSDANGSLIYAQKYTVKDATFHGPTIVTRRFHEKRQYWKVTGMISADQAVYNPRSGTWNLLAGRYIKTDSRTPPQPLAHYQASDLIPKEIPLKIKADDKTLLSYRQLGELSTKTKRDLAQLYSQRHFHITDPIINFVILMVSLPVLLCRDPKTMKSAVLVSFALTGACIITSCACKMLASEPILRNQVLPAFWAWLPVFIFMPVAFIEIDGMKT
jgi:lipopolysaccharide export system permease protein